MGAKLVVGLGLQALSGFREVLGFLHRVGGEERRVIAVFAHGQGDEAFFSQLEFLAIGDQHFGRDLRLQLAQ
ncbi:hypothetical protein D3C79_1047200 [compost metagenome]